MAKEILKQVEPQFRATTVTPKLELLFNQVSLLIERFCEESSNDETSLGSVEVSRLVAGHICKDDIAYLVANFKALQPVIHHKTSGWNNYMSVKGKEVAGKGKFEGVRALGNEWRSLPAAEKDLYKAMSSTSAAAKRRKVVEVNRERTVQSQAYLEQSTVLENECKKMLQNFGTHMIMISVTDTRKRNLFPSEVFFNSRIAADAVKEMENDIQSSLCNDLQRHVDMKGEVGRSTQMKEKNIASLSNITKDNAVPSASTTISSVYSRREAHDDPRSSNEIRKSCKKMLDSCWEKVSEKKYISWKKIRQSIDFELVGWPENIKFPVINKKDGREEVSLKALHVTELIALEKLFVENKLFFQKKDSTITTDGIPAANASSVTDHMEEDSNDE